MDTNTILERALAIAVEAHAGQVDSVGQPYILHVLRVAMPAPTPVLQAAGFLHDVVEDCPAWPLERLAAKGFPPEVLEVVDLLTHRPEHTYEQYIDRLSAHRGAIRLKLLDLADNMNPLRRGTVLGPEVLERFNRYLAAHRKLSAILAADLQA